MKNILMLLMMIGCCIGCEQPNSDKDNQMTPSYDPSQTDDIAKKEGQTPQEVKDAMMAKYGDQKVSWARDDNGYFEATFKKENIKYRAEFTPIGEWVETQNSVDFDDLPKNIQNYVTQNYDKRNIAELNHVQHHDKGEFYEFNIKKEGNTNNVEITPSGEILSE